MVGRKSSRSQVVVGVVVKGIVVVIVVTAVPVAVVAVGVLVNCFLPSWGRCRNWV